MRYNNYRGKKKRGGGGGKKWLAALLALVILGVLCFAGLEACIGLHSRDRMAGEPRVMVIFGCQMRRDGPSILLRDRLDKALEYLGDHPDMKIIVTGGKGDDEHVSEAQGMYDYLTAHGVDGHDILLEDQSRNTHQNIRNTLALMGETSIPWAGSEDGPGSYVLVSSDFHLARILMLWGRAAGTTANVSTLPAPVSHAPSRVQMTFREPLALVKSFLFDR